MWGKRREALTALVMAVQTLREDVNRRMDAIDVCMAGLRSDVDTAYREAMATGKLLATVSTDTDANRRTVQRAQDQIDRVTAFLYEKRNGIQSMQSQIDEMQNWRRSIQPLLNSVQWGKDGENDSTT